MEERKSDSNSAVQDWEPPRGRRWSEADARDGLSAARSSGKPLSRFAREHGIEVSRFYWWAKELKKKPAKPAAFLPVRVVEKRGASERQEGGNRQNVPAVSTVDVVVGSKRVVRVGRGFDPALLRAVIVALETETC
jgi:transposase-like protein